MRTLASRIFIASLISLSLIACGGGGGSSQQAGIGGTGVTSSGSVSGFGSIFVNGVEYDTDGNTNVSGSISTVPEIKLGMTVTVRGTLNSDGITGTADTIAVQSEIEGPVAAAPVENTSAGTKTFSILGLTVIISNSGTVYDGGINYSNLKQNDVVEVSGYLDSNGALIATRIEGKGTLVLGSTQVEVKGNVASISTSSFQLTIGGSNFTINHNTGTDFSGVPGNTVTIGQNIEVEGILNTTTEIGATKVSLQSTLLNNQDTEVELEGIITNYISDADFMINGQRINASGATKDPSTLVLANDVEVEVEGTFNNNILVADEVESEKSEAKIEATVSATNPGNNTVTLTFASGQDVTVAIDNGSTLEDETGVITDPTPFTVSDIASGDYLEVQAFTNNSSVLTVLDLHRKSFDLNGEAELKGTVTAIDTSTAGAESVTILGVVYPTDSNTVFMEEINDVSTPITRTQFLNRISINSVVKVKENYIAGSLSGVADEMEIDN